jgi:SAM-dependent methyltransferase
MSVSSPGRSTSWTAGFDPWRCVACGSGLEGAPDALACGSCGHVYPIRDGVLVVRDEVADNNRVARDFYNGPLWPKFRVWEHVFWFFNGGERRAREKVLRHLPTGPALRLLDVAIGDGVYLDWLPRDWQITGVDISTAQLAACRRRAEGRDVRLTLAEAEDLPFRDGQFDAVLSIGGLNHFNHPGRALDEMARVAKRGAPVVVSDEVPDLTGRMLGHMTGIPALIRLDNWFVAHVMHLGRDFTDLVERNRHLDVAALGRKALEDCTFEWIWRKGGYVLVGKSPRGRVV